MNYNKYICYSLIKYENKNINIEVKTKFFNSEYCSKLYFINDNKIYA